MKKIAKHLVLLVMVVSALCSCVSAMENSNAYIRSGSAYIYKWADGDISVEYTVTGTDIMDTIGAHQVTVYKMLGDKIDAGKDELVKTYWYTNYPDMMGEKDVAYHHSIRLNVEAGERYYAVVVFYATLGGGGGNMPYCTTAVVG